MKFSWFGQRGTPIIAAHRGSSAIAPENTLSAFRQALLDKADAVELDVRMTRDGEIVVIHDSYLDRTTNGHGKVKNFPLSDLKKLDAGKWFGKKFASEKVPTLSEVLELVKGKIGINIEVKSTAGGSPDFNFIEKLIGIIDEYNIADSVLISSFHREIIKTVKTVKPDITTGLICSPVNRLFGKNICPDFLIYSKNSLRKKTAHRGHKLGYRVGVYVVNSPRLFSRLLNWEVDCIYSDNPALLIKMSES